MTKWEYYWHLLIVKELEDQPGVWHTVSTDMVTVVVTITTVFYLKPPPTPHLVENRQGYKEINK